MKLYDLRREPEMRKARAWFATFVPRSAEDVIQVVNGVPPQENAPSQHLLGHGRVIRSARRAERRAVRGQQRRNVFCPGEGLSVLERNPREDKHSLSSTSGKSRHWHQTSSRTIANDGEEGRGQAGSRCEGVTKTEIEEPRATSSKLQL